MLHYSTLDLTKVKSNLEEAMYSQILLMQQNSGRAGQFAAAFVSIADAIKHVDSLIRDKEDENKAPTKSSKKQDT